MSNKRMFLFVMTIIFMIISVSAVSAADDSVDDTISSSDVSQTSLDNSVDTQQIVKEESNVKTSSESNNVQNDVATTKQIVKEEQNIKTAPKTIVITNNTVKDYFNILGVNLPDNGTNAHGLKDSVSAGDVLDFQGKIGDGSWSLVIDKPVNITASKGNCNISLNTTASSMFGDDELPTFSVVKSGSYTNITGIYLYNTQFFVRNAKYVKINNIRTEVRGQKVGSGVGQTSIRENSSYITVENSTFTTENNGGSSTFVLAWADHCTIRNNRMTGIGNVGNLLYLTTYNVDGLSELQTVNNFNVIDNNTLVGPAVPQSICYGIAVCGQNNTVSNNKIYYNGTGITTQWITGEAGQSINTTIKNNYLEGCSLYAPIGGIVTNNTVLGELIPRADTQIYNNTVNSVRFTSDTVLTNNTINGNVAIQPSTQNVLLANCTINGNISIAAETSSSSIPKNITFDNLQVNGCILLSSASGAVDKLTVTNNNITDGIYFSSKRTNQIKNVLIENNTINSDDEYAVYVNKTVTNVTIQNNRINSTSRTGDDAVFVNGDYDVTVKNNSVPPKQTQITLNTVPNAIYVNESITISGTFKVEGKASKATSIDVYDNNSKIATVSSNDNGVFNYTYKSTKAGQHNISFRFAQNATLFASNTSKTITVNDLIITSITLSGNSSVYYNDNLVITGTFKAANAAAKVNAVDVYDNNAKVATVGPSGTNGVFNYTYKSTNVGSHNLTFKFAGNVSHLASQASKTVTVNKIPTSITLTNNPNSVYVTQTVAFNATFKANNAAAKVNSMDVYDNNAKIATVGPSGNNGVVSYTYTATTVGSHNITFKFATNASHAASEATKTITVNNPLATNIALTSASSVIYNDNLAINGTIKANNAGIKANLDVYDNGSKLTTISSATDGKFNYTYKSTNVGSHNLTFKFAGNVSHLASQASKTVTVNKIPTSITLTNNPNSVYVTQTVAFNATFKANNAAAKVNSMDVYDNNAKIATVGPSGNNGVVSYTYTATTVGSHNITFKFATNASHAASEATKTITVNNPLATNIALTSASSVVYNDNLAINGTIKANNAGITANLDVYDNGSKLTTISSATDGKFNYTYKASKVGTHNITFKFAGNVSHVASEASKTITVNPMQTSITLTNSANSVYVTENVAFNATFKAANVAAKVNGIDVYDNNVKVATVGPSGNNGVVSYTYNATTAGSHNITFKFAGNETHQASEATKTITVNNPIATSITLTSNRTSLFVTEKANITGTFKENNKAIKVNSITVTDNGKQVATVGPTGANGVFNYIFDGTTAGSHNLTFSFAGNVSHQASQSSIVIKVEEPNATSISLTANATELFVDQSAKVDALFAFDGQTTGTYVDVITVSDNGKQVATVGPSNDGKLNYTYLAKEVGSHNLTFSFAGNVSHIASEASIAIVVKEPDAISISLSSDVESLYVDEAAGVDVLFAYDGESSGTYVDVITVSDNGEVIATIGPADEGVLNYTYLAKGVGSHNLTFSFAGNNTHAASEASIVVVVKEPDATQITLNVDGETEFNVTESSDIEGVFAYEGQEEGTYVDLITIYENGEEIATVGPSEDGKFNYTYTPQKPGDHELRFAFAGNNTHAASEATVIYHIRGYVLKVDTTEFVKGSNATLQASIYFEDQVSTDINTGKVTFKINGKTVKDANGKIIYAKIVNGTAKIENYTIPDEWDKKNITIQAVSSASSQIFKLKSELETLKIVEEIVDEPVFTTESIDATVGAQVTFKATIKDSDKVINEGKVVFKVNGKTLKDANGKIIYVKVVNNQAVLDYEIPESWKVKQYTITAVFYSSTYERLQAESNLTISD